MSYTDELFNVSGKIALLTGGGGVLAGAIGEGLAKAGATVIFLDLKPERSKKRVDEINKNGGKAATFACNVLDIKCLEGLCDHISKEYGPPDILINLAGGNMPGATIESTQTVFDMTIPDFEKVLSLNLNGTVYPSLVFGREMAKRKSGVIINISSMAAFRAITRVVGYSAAKAAVSNFTRWMAMEMAMKFGDGIRVNALAPGFFIGTQNKGLLLKEDGTYTERGQKVISHTPMKRFGEAHELVGPVIFLSSKASQFVTGVVLPVDGGFEIFSGI